MRSNSPGRSGEVSMCAVKQGQRQGAAGDRGEKKLLSSAAARRAARCTAVQDQTPPGD